MKMERSVLIAGGGKVGAYLATLLQESGLATKIVEIRPDVAERLRSGGLDAIHGSAVDADVAERAGIRAATSVVAVTGADETNLAVASMARHEFGVPRVIARVVDPRNAWMFGPELGVDAAVNQADILAHLALEELSLGELTILLKLRRGLFELVEEEIRPDGPADGQAVGDIDLPPSCVIVGVMRGDELLAGRRDLGLRSGDRVLAVVASREAADLESALGGTAPAPGSGRPF